MMVSGKKNGSQARTETSPLSSQSIQLSPLVLIFENDDENRLMLKTLLETWNYKVAEAENIDEIVPIAESRKPDLIIIDISFSLMEGLIAICRIRKTKNLINIPILFTSGHAQPELSAAAMAMGGSDFLVKPIDFDKLKSSLNKFIPLQFFNEKIFGEY